MAAAGYDLVRRVIPNWLNLIVLVTGAVWAFYDPNAGDAWSHIAHFAIALVAGMLLFKFGAWGGGDGKLYAACAVSLPLQAAPLFALTTAVAGVLLVVAFGIVRRVSKMSSSLSALPYGVAIAVGAICTHLIFA
ncbi:prepilin peptidase [Altererythrobacter sp. HHU K3-1]|uniref:Prepilin peptidase n=1 Tax=Qipengyuania atrilutea TaxID=2744473 RepID=A0A850GYU1_9SPHN|nr:prepilin peptidase [Actirhodobacter atriluteus]